MAMNSEFDFAAPESVLRETTDNKSSASSTLGEYALQIGTLSTTPNEGALKGLAEIGELEIDFGSSQKPELQFAPTQLQSASNDLHSIASNTLDVKTLAPDLAARVDALLRTPTVLNTAGDEKLTIGAMSETAKFGIMASSIPRNTGIGAVIGGIAGTVKGAVQWWVLQRYSSVKNPAVFASAYGDLSAGAAAGAIGGAVLTLGSDTGDNVGGNDNQATINGNPYTVFTFPNGATGFLGSDGNAWTVLNGRWHMVRNGQLSRPGRPYVPGEIKY